MLNNPPVDLAGFKIRYQYGTGGVWENMADLHQGLLSASPYETLILTVSVISIEVIMILAIMITGENNPTLARDTLFSVLMIVLNGMVGLTLILDGLRYWEQRYNLKGASAYLAVIIPLAGLSRDKKTSISERSLTGVTTL